ncbi:MAG: DUF5916 domain-containing protein [Vicinamibacterales bacterium]
MRRLPPALLLLPLALALPSSAAAQATTQADLAALPRAERVARLRQRSWDVTAVRAEGSMVLDGRLDEADWARATPIEDFYQGQRNEGLPATEKTSVRVVYDSQQLYIGFRAWDDEPGKVKARGIFRDESAGADDAVSLMIDAYHGHRNAIQLVTNASGLVEDLLQTGESTSTRNHDWDAVWNSKGRMLPDGYEVEIAIPFKSMRFEPPADGEPVVFGIGFKRNIPRKNEEVYWPFVPNDSTWYRPAELGHLHGLSAVRPGRNLEFRPYVLGGAGRTFGDGAATTYKREAGLDAKWGVTTGITADFTVNTDFAQEEADVQQVNLTRFSLFFPEKRQFFLEGQQAFRFGVPRQADIIFTRRIGLSETGTPVRLLGGARLSGRQGRNTVGAMSLQVDAHGDTPGQNFTVLRVKRDVLARSSVGAVFTNVQGGGAYNRVVGADANLYVNRVWFFDGWVARVDQSGGRPGGNAGYGRAAYETDRRGLSYTFLGLADGFEPGVGFVQRPATRQHDAIARWSPRPQSDLFRQFHLTGELSYITDTAGTPETRERSAQFKADFETGDAVVFKATNTMENLQAPFDLRRDITLAPGTYTFSEVEATFDSFRRRHLQMDVTATAGGFWDGSRESVRVNFNWRASAHLGIVTTYTVNWVDLPLGAFTTHLVSTRLQTAFSNSLALLTLVQYNRDTRQFASNVRFNWIPKPGTDFFIVYNETDDTRGAWLPRNRSLSVKLNYLFAL